MKICKKCGSTDFKKPRKNGYADCRPCTLKRYAENAEKNKERKREYHEKNKERINELKRLSYANNKESYKETIKKWRDANREKLRAQDKERKNKKREGVVSKRRPSGSGAHPLYKTWVEMKYRCNNPGHSKYKYYGGRGIKVCKEWEDFLTFLRDMGEKPKGHSLDRIDVNGNYEPSNCRWATQLIQVNNRTISKKINIDGKTYSLSEIEKMYGIPYKTLYKRLNDGWDEVKAATHPVRKNRRFHGE